MKYGLFRYSYTYPGHHGYFCNIGDYVQSLAAKQFLPRVDTFVDRDNLAAYNGEPVKVIMNGWYNLINPKNATPSKNIIPLFVSMHIDQTWAVKQESLDYLKKHEPIGCRDYSTMNFLKSHGVAAYFTGCLTLTLGQTYVVPPEERTDSVYWVNVDRSYWLNKLKSRIFPSQQPLIPKSTRSRLEEIIGNYCPDVNKCKHFYRNHVPLRRLMSEPKRFDVADRYLKDYARAKLVVTNRIHSALPCAGMGVPVILIMPNPQDPRYKGLTDYLNRLGVNTKGEIIEHLFLTGEPGAKRILLSGSPEIKTVADNLAAKCLEFVNAS
jgi:hypothetical protein